MARAATEFTGYQNNNSILIQFILFDLSEALTLCEELRPLLNTKKRSAMESRIASLAGQKFISPFNWSLQEGFIAKLKRHAANLSENSKDELFLTFAQQAHLVWLHSISFLEETTIHTLEKVEKGLNSL